MISYLVYVAQGKNQAPLFTRHYRDDPQPKNSLNTIHNIKTTSCSTRSRVAPLPMDLIEKKWVTYGPLNPILGESLSISIQQFSKQSERRRIKLIY
jgi:hypothetical protein